VKSSRGPLLLVLCSFYKQNVSMALQQMHVASILRHVVIIGEDSSRLNVFSSVFPLSLSDVFLATRGLSI